MVHKDPSIRATYSAEQLQQYFERIKLPAKYRASPVISNPAAANTADGLHFLSKLMRYQLAAVPWENLELHYSTHHSKRLDPAHLFRQIVERPTGRGGYCMENTALLATVLRSLGYDVMSTAGRVNEAIQPVSASPNWGGPKYDGWNHMVNIVTIASQRYLVDVGFGSNSPTFPVPLRPDFTALNIHPAHSIQLTRTHIPDNTHRTAPEQLMWVMSLRFTDDAPWTPGYCFSEIEFLPNDFVTMNFFVSQSPTSWFTYYVVALKYLMDAETEEMVGDITLFNNDIKERRNGESTELAEITSEADRVAALEKFLGIHLTEEERAGIRGMSSQII